MNEIAWIQDTNPAGVLLLECSPQLLLHGGATAVALGPLVLTTADPWLRIYGSENTKSYDEDEQLTEHGPLYQVNAGLFLPGDTRVIRSFLKSMTWYRWVIRITDSMGVTRQAGTASEALDMLASFGISPEMAGQRGFSIRFSGALTTRPVIVE